MVLQGVGVGRLEMEERKGVQAEEVHEKELAVHVVGQEVLAALEREKELEELEGLAVHYWLAY